MASIYSYTEKKRIRKNFGRIANVAVILFLREKNERTRAVTHMKERAPLQSFPKNFDLIMENTVKTENVDDQIKPHFC